MIIQWSSFERSSPVISKQQVRIGGFKGGQSMAMPRPWMPNVAHCSTVQTINYR